MSNVDMFSVNHLNICHKHISSVAEIGQMDNLGQIINSKLAWEELNQGDQMEKKLKAYD